MTDEEANEVLKELDEVRPEMLNDKAKRLFEAIMIIADTRDEYKEAIKKKDKIIDKMADKLSEYTCWNKDDLNMNKLAPIEEIIEYFTNKVEEKCDK